MEEETVHGLDKNLALLLPKLQNHVIGQIDLTTEFYLQALKGLSDLQAFTSFNMRIIKAILFFGGTPAYDPEYIRIYLKEKEGHRELKSVKKEDLKDVLAPVKIFPFKPSIKGTNLRFLENRHQMGIEILADIHKKYNNNIVLRIANRYNILSFINCTIDIVEEICVGIGFNQDQDDEQNGRYIYILEDFVIDLYIYKSIEDVVFKCGVDSMCVVYDLKSDMFYYNERFEYSQKFNTNTLNFELLYDHTEEDLIRNNGNIYIPLFDRYRKILQVGEFVGNSPGFREIRYRQMCRYLNFKIKYPAFDGNFACRMTKYNYPDPISWFCPKKIAEDDEYVEEAFSTYEIVSEDIVSDKNKEFFGEIFNVYPNLVFGGTAIKNGMATNENLVVLSTQKYNYLEFWQFFIAKYLNIIQGQNDGDAQFYSLFFRIKDGSIVDYKL